MKQPSRYFQSVNLRSSSAKTPLKPPTRKIPVPDEAECMGGRKVTQNNSRDAILHATAQGLLKYPLGHPHRTGIRLLSPEEIRAASVVTITSDDRNPRTQGGINDMRMGSVNRNEQCCTCFQIVCQGHMGEIELKYPIINPLEGRVVLHIMNSVCNDCGNLLIKPSSDEKISKLSGLNRLAAISKISAASISKSKKRSNMSVIKCHRTVRKGEKPCRPNPVYEVKESKNKNYLVYVDPNNLNKKLKMYPDRIRLTLDAITEETAIELGFASHTKPSSIIITNLPVTPPITRPGMIGRSFNEPTTAMYRRIIKINNSNPKNDETSDNISDKLYDAIYELFVAPKKGKTNEDAKSFTQQVTGKEEVIRGSMMGKRVNDSARAVLSPGWELMFGQIGIPSVFGEKWQHQVTVTRENLNSIKDLHIQGKLKIYESIDTPGVIIHIRPEMGLVFKPGDRVKRVIDDGDVVAFNRQPSLHKGSFLSYTCSMIKDIVIRLHPSSTTPHNADFDGDAAHVYFPMLLAAIRELFLIMHAGNNLINEKQNKPLVGLVMDTISSAWLLSKPDEGIDPHVFNEIIQFSKRKTDPKFNITYLQNRAESYGLHPYSGRTLFSALFKDNFYYEKDTDEGKTLICQGILVMGRIKSTHIGIDNRTILQDIWHQFDSVTGADFLTEGTWMLVAWLNTFGFSIGPADCEFGRLESKRRKIEKLKIDGQLATLGPVPSNLIEARNYENKVISLVDQSKVIGKDITQRAMKESNPIKGRQNTIGIMVLSGAKAGVFNIAQIGVSAGQQYTSSQRPIPRLSGGTRFLPTQPKRPKGELAPITERGYCTSSYWEGMNPEEMFYLFWGARQNLIDTSRSTADVGATQRSISKALESMVIMADGSGRDAAGSLYFSIWGGDGLDSEAMLQVKTKEFGNVPSFIDISTISRRHNMEAGWVSEVVNKAIKENRENYNLVENKIRQYSNPTNYRAIKRPGVLVESMSNILDININIETLSLQDQIGLTEGTYVDIWKTYKTVDKSDNSYITVEEMREFYNRRDIIDKSEPSIVPDIIYEENEPKRKSAPSIVPDIIYEENEPKRKSAPSREKVSERKSIPIEEKSSSRKSVPKEEGSSSRKSVPIIEEEELIPLRPILLPLPKPKPLTIKRVSEEVHSPVKEVFPSAPRPRPVRPILSKKKS